MVMNITRQPNASISPVSSGGAMNGPMLPPELYTPVGLPRSFTWNQSLVTRTAAGKRRTFGGTQRDARPQQLDVRHREAARRLRQRPHHQRHADQPAGAQPVEEIADRHLAEAHR